MPKRRGRGCQQVICCARNDPKGQGKLPVEYPTVVGRRIEHRDALGVMGGQILINKHALLFRCVLTFGDEIDKTFVVKSFDRGKVAMGDPFFAIKGPDVIIDPAK